GAITLSCVESGGELEGKQLGTVARETHRQDVDAMFDLLSSHAGRALAIYHWPQSIPGEAIIKRSLAHPLYIGSTDGIYMGSRPHGGRERSVDRRASRSGGRPLLTLRGSGRGTPGA